MNEAEQNKTIEEPPGRRPIPPSLHKIPSYYEQFVGKYGEPVVPDHRFLKWDLSRNWDEAPILKLEQIVSEWQCNPEHGMRHMPVMWFVINQYRFRRSQAKSAASGPTPKHIEYLLRDIENSANKLRSYLDLMLKSSSEFQDPLAPEKIPHLKWINIQLQHAIAGRFSNRTDSTVDTDALNHPQIYLENNEHARNFYSKIWDLSLIAKNIREKHLDKTLLARRPGGKEDPALLFLIEAAIPIWKSLSGRQPSISPRNIPSGAKDPLFVQFIQELAVLGYGPKPTRKQVASAMPKKRTQLPSK